MEHMKKMIGFRPKGTKASLVEDYDKKVRPIIDLIDKLRRIGLDKDVGLPAIVVVGDQSAGKSSVLEAISGVQLPRGSGIVTRCPLELRLKKSANPGWHGKIIYRDTENELHIPGEVGDLVREAQNAIAGEGKQVSDELITLEIESPDLPDLTLVDLPGIIRVTARGHHYDTTGKIQDLIKHYIKKPETIILAVIAANVDIETTGALKMASKVDPEGKRTLGVITKCDLIDKGTGQLLIDALHGEIYPLQKGYFAVKCRGQEDLNNNLTLAEAVKREEKFFKSQPHFKDVDENLYGIKSLSTRLADELVEQVQRVLPTLREEIYRKRDEKRKALLKLGDGVPENDADKSRFLIKIINAYNDELKNLRQGQGMELLSRPTLYNMARMAFEQFAKSIKQYRSSAEYKDVEKALQENRGPELPHFIKFETFQSFIITIVKTFDQPAKQCLGSVEKSVKDKLLELAKNKFSGLSMVESKVKELVISVIRAAAEKAEQSIDELLEMEELVYSQDEHYNAGLAKLKQQELNEEMEKAQARRMPDYSSQTNTIDTMLTLMRAYMQIAEPRIADLVPMIIKQNLIKYTINQLSDKILDLAEPSMGLLGALKEEQSTKWKRDQLKKALDRLEKATVELNAYQIKW